MNRKRVMAARCRCESGTLPSDGNAAGGASIDPRDVQVNG